MDAMEAFHRQDMARGDNASRLAAKEINRGEAEKHSCITLATRCSVSGVAQSKRAGISLLRGALRSCVGMQVVGQSVLR
jgi:hypothetical protein